MITENELKDRCTPEIIKRMCELAEGFEFIDREVFNNKNARGFKYNGWSGETTENVVSMISNHGIFPILIHRAVEGWDNDELTPFVIEIHTRMIRGRNTYRFKNYQPTTLTSAECAMLDCLLEVLK